LLLNKTIRYLRKHLKNYYIYYILLAVILVAGIVIGPLIMNLFSLRVKILILRLANPFYKIALFNDDIQHSVMKVSLINNIYTILLIYILTLLNVGMYIIPLILLIKGIFIGFTVGFLVNNLGLKGFLLSIGGIYPQNVFFIIGLIGLGAISMSQMKSNRGPLGSLVVNNPRSINESLLLSLTFSIIILLGAVMEGLLSPRFLSFTLEFFV